MKNTLGVLLTVILATSLVAQDETEQQIKQAQEAAKQMGVKAPDMQKLMEESAKEDEAEAAATTEATTTTQSSSPVAARVKVDIPAGTAKGSLTYDGNTTELKFAAAFTDQKDDRKPVILIVSDQKLPAEKWTSEFDMMRDKTKWSGIVVFVDKEGEVYRTDVHNKGEQSSVSGMFDVNFNDPKSADLAGTAKTSSDSAERKLDLSFHALRK